MDGVELARRARRVHPGLPILLVTGFADPQAQAVVSDLGISVLPKPFTLKALAERIEGLD
jgi:two-component system cell cycle sensor histidine kinase/response regulator CckA